MTSALGVRRRFYEHREMLIFAILGFDNLGDFSAGMNQRRLKRLLSLASLAVMT